MDFSLKDDERIFREKVAEFSRRNISPRWIEMDEKGEIPTELIKKMGDNGLLALPVAEDYGGQDGLFLHAAIAAEEIAYYAPALSVAVFYILQCSWPYVLQLYGTEEAKKIILPYVTRGESAFGIASTESQGGSDIGNVLFRAERIEGKKWLLNGEKSIVSLPALIEKLPWGGGWMLVARTGPVELRHKGITNFASLFKQNGRKTPGISYQLWSEIGRHGMDTGIIKFDNVDIDDEFRVGDVGGGFKIAMEGFNLARSIIGAICVGCARWLMDQGLEWIRNRKSFGKPLAGYQGISFKFAEYYLELEAARMLCYKSAWLADRYYKHRDPTVKLSDIAVASAASKLKASNLAVDVGQEVMKWYGGAAYFKEVPLFRAWLGAFSYVAGAEGAQNIMKLIIAREVIGRQYTE